MKNIIPNEIYIMVGLWKAWYYKKLLSNGKNQLSGGLTKVGELCEFFLSNALERLFCFVEMIMYLAIWSGKLVVFSHCQIYVSFLDISLIGEGPETEVHKYS